MNVQQIINNPNKAVAVNVHWLRPEEGGRRALPNGGRYMAVTYLDQPPNADSIAWTVVLDFTEYPAQQGYDCHAEAHFLSPNAPFEQLLKLRPIDLYEGHKKVAWIR
ncbi:hypothetical protein [Thioflexithrix psekupsensis]|uniref:Uncharacterized protein n=1 Tax=Thioflexithrix psekupsensis TaxID=1570016 RepID=A0A251X6L3_9GAMM|nr:hypothetical protein [Thioflexithrix psekupsensis]OUD13278.1 hypothetical protein TPSD3_11650 [Thioflexithrix psekupsensis]